MFRFLIALLLSFALSTSCADSYISRKPELYTKSIDFIKPGDSIATTVFDEKLDFTAKGRKDVYFNSCNDLLVYNFQNIATYEQFRFKLIAASCTAIYKYLNAKPSKSSFFPTDFSNDFILNLPANITPIINAYMFNQKKEKTIKQAFNIEKIQIKNNSFNVLSPEDKLYIDILARGDFNNDGVEDLIISTAWYARNARGKVNDLVIVTKKAEDQSMEITWRMHGSVYGPDPGSH